MPLPLYVHIPFCRSKCAYCDFFSVPINARKPRFSFERYIKALLNEINAKLALYRGEGFSTVYIGGGSPSLMPAECAALFCAGVRQINVKSCRGINAASPIEWTVEMNPADVTEELLKAWGEGGANRLSLGVQSLSDKTLKAIGRRGRAEQNIAALTLASSVWRGELSVDLIAGLPYQSAADLCEDISAVLAFNPAHISLYQLTLEEGAPLFALSAAGAVPLPDDDEAALIWNAGKDMLANAGLLRYEVSNFALKGHECRHNIAYWHLNSFIGAGPGATGTLVRGSACTRLENTKDIDEWLAFWENEECAALFAEQGATAIERAHMRVEQVGYADFAFETLMMGMRLTSGVSEAAFRARFAEGLDGLFGATLQKWESAGRLKREGGCASLTDDGLLFLNAFLLECLTELSSNPLLAKKGV